MKKHLKAMGLHGAKDHGAQMRALAEAAMPNVMALNSAPSAPAPSDGAFSAPPPAGLPPTQPGAAGGMKRGGKAYAKGGAAHADEKADKKLIRNMVKGEDLKKAKGGSVHGRSLNSQETSKSAGYDPERGHESRHHSKNPAYMAAGGVGKIRHEQATSAGAPKAGKPKFKNTAARGGN